MTCRLSLAITSSRSLRCYAAGAIYEIVDAISWHNQTSADDKHIALDILVGTRTGACIAAVLKQTLALHTGPAEEPYDHLLYRAFVEDEKLPSTVADCGLGTPPTAFVLKSDLCPFGKSNSSPTGGHVSEAGSPWLCLHVPAGEGVSSWRRERELNFQLPVTFGKTARSKGLSDPLTSIQNSSADQAEARRLEVWHEGVASKDTQPLEGTSLGDDRDTDTLLAFAALIARSVDLALTPSSRLFLRVGSSIGFSEVFRIPADEKKGQRSGEAQDACSSPRAAYRALDYEVNVNRYELAGPQLEAAEGEFGRYYRDHDYNVGRRHAHTVLTEMGRRAGAVPHLRYRRRAESLASGPRMTLWLSR
jgi:hypothetical protein